MKAAFQCCEDTTFIKVKKQKRNTTNDDEMEVVFERRSDKKPHLSITCTDIGNLPPLFTSFDTDEKRGLICLPVLHSQMEKNHKHAELENRGVRPLEPLILLGNETEAQAKEELEATSSVAVPPAYLIDFQIAKCRAI